MFFYSIFLSIGTWHSKMANIPFIVGIAFMFFGGLMAGFGFYSCLNSSVG